MTIDQEIKALYDGMDIRSGLIPGMWNIRQCTLPRKKSIEELKKAIEYMATKKINSKRRAQTLRKIGDETGATRNVLYYTFKGKSYSPMRFDVVKKTEGDRFYVDGRRLKKIRYISFLEGLEAYCK